MKKSFDYNTCLTWFFVLFYFSPFIFAILSPIVTSTYEEIKSHIDYAKITDVEYTAKLVDEPNSNGKVIITEKLTFDVRAASQNNLFWELWRALPEDTIDGLKVDYKVNSVKQILDDGTEIVYDESSKLYWDDYDYIDTTGGFGPNKWYHSKGPYNEYMRQYECVLFYVNGLYRDKVTYEIEYEMNNAAFKYNDCSELYLCMYSEETIKELNSFKGQILIPNKDMPKNGNYYAHTYGTDLGSFDFTESKTLNPGYHTFEFALNKSNLKFNNTTQYIEFALVSYGDDKHIFTENAPNNNYSSTNVLDELKYEHDEYVLDYKKTQTAKHLILFFCWMGATIVIICAISTNKRITKKYKFYKSTNDIEFFRDIPSDLDPAFASTFVFCKHKPLKEEENIYSAITLSLVRKGYIELAKIDNTKDWDLKNVKIIIKQKPISLNLSSLSSTVEQDKLEHLTHTEEYYFNLITRHASSNEIIMKKFQEKVSSDFENTNSFLKKVELAKTSIGVIKNYFINFSYDKPRKELLALSSAHMWIGILIIILLNFISNQTSAGFAFGGFFILGFSFIFSSLYIKKQALKYVLLTQFGEDEYAKWRGLYNFLNSNTLINERTVIELPLWEKYLIYATAFGISKKVTEALKIRCPEMIETSPILNNSYYHSTHFHSSSHSFTRSTNSAYHSARNGGYGSYSGRYGSHSYGYGGGGRGGGGGRRRSLITNSKVII